jgi:hypothetical protein
MDTLLIRYFFVGLGEAFRFFGSIFEKASEWKALSIGCRPITPGIRIAKKKVVFHLDQCRETNCESRSMIKLKWRRQLERH